MQQVAIAAGRWLDSPAAASYQRMRAAGMPAGGINDAGRTYAEQASMYAAYLAGRLLATASKPGTSKHESGRALDLSTSSAAHRWMLAHGATHGWSRPLLHAKKPEPWHWEYTASADHHLLDGVVPVSDIAPPTPAAPAVPAAPAAPTLSEDDMIRISAPGRGVGMVGPGYYRHCATDEEVAVAGALATKTLDVNDRQYDVMVALATQGVTPDSDKAALERLSAIIEALPQDQWWDVTVRRGDEHIPVIQELADIKTMLMGRAG